MLAHKQGAILLYTGSIFYACSLRRKVLDRAGRRAVGLMAPVGFEPTTNGLCLPLRLSPRCWHGSSQSLWSGLYLHFTCLPS